MQRIIARITGKVEGRVPEGRPIDTPDERYEFMHGQYLNRPWLEQLIHQPAGWHGSMTGAQWASMSVEMQDAYTRAYLDAVGGYGAPRPGLKLTVYGGEQWYGPFTNRGDTRPPGERFDQEPWCDPRNRVHREGLLDLTIAPWVQRGVTGWVFDLGSKVPAMVQEWQERIWSRWPFMTTGLEALPTRNSTTDWTWAVEHNLEYHALKQFRNGTPFDEKVPDGATAFVWLRGHKPVASDWIKAVWDRGWSLCVDEVHDQLVLDTLGADAEKWL